MNTLPTRLARRPAWRWSLMLPLAMLLQAAQAGPTDLADVPLFTSSANAVKPNVMFILDDSGSMNSNYMPDDANFSTSKYGARAPQCNGLAYNPTTDYKPPVDSVGVPSPNGSTSAFSSDPNARATSQRALETASLTVFSSGSLTVTFPASPAPANGWYSNGNIVTVFSTTDTVKYMEGTVASWDAAARTLVINVTAADGVGSTISGLRVGNGGLPFYYRYTGGEPALGYTYTAAGVITGTTFYQECSSNIGSTPGSSVFTEVRMSSASADAQNYANWNTYYRTRMQMAKAGISLAFKDITDRYRVGFTTISKTTAAPDAKFLNINTYDATQKTAFYTSLYAASPSGFTPLRGALSKAGRYFANKAPGQTADPIQYACQKNFTILTTDGYWNTDNETGTYGPLDLAGAAVGQQDGPPTEYPMRDGADAVTTTVSTWNTTRKLVTRRATTTTSYTTPVTTTTDTYGAMLAANTRTDTYTGQRQISSMARCASGTPCTISVTTSGAHGYLPGQFVTIVDGTQTQYRGTWQLVTASGSSFTFSRAAGRPSANASGTYYVLPQGNGTTTCPAGQGLATQTRVQTDRYPITRTRQTTATQVDTTAYTQNEETTITPYTRTVVLTNGATTSDNTVTGTPGVTNAAQTPPLDDVVTSPYATAVTTVSPAPSPLAVVTTTVNPAACVTSRATVTATSVPAASTVPVPASSNAGTTIASSTAAAVTTTVSDNTVASATTSTSTSSSTGGYANALADVAMYYYKNDLRTSALSNCAGALGAGTSVCQTTDVGGETTNARQSMQTFTIGFGVSGTLKFTKDYLKNPAAGDYFALTQGTKRWPNPSDTSEGPTNIDDLWHAAVNGGGKYFSAGDPASVVASVQETLRAIDEKLGTASAAATSTLQPVDGDNDIFVAEFTSGSWVGDVKRYSIDPASGVITTTPSWSAAQVLAARDLVASPRKIYYFKPGTGNTGTLREFTHANLSADGLNGHVDGFCGKPGSGGAAASAQCAGLSAADLATANGGANLVGWLRGGSNAVYRNRTSALGDIINSSPVFVGAPKFKYTENSYGSFASSKASRAGVLYMGANDGALHALDRLTGTEKWAYMPSDSLPNLYKLADTDYPFNHQNFVDGSPQVGDVWDGTQWRTILVGGMNKGGRMYFALDITDPDNPVALWEFRDPNLGWTYGNPVITKRKDGTWVVAFASGYNNVGDGNGYLFVLDAITGAKLVTPVPTYTAGTTPAGTAATPSGLAKINAFIASEIDNTAKVFYGGDLLGNVWRFDIDSNVAPFNSAFLMARLVVGGVPQPITIKPEIAEVNYSGTTFAVVYVGTGRYLGTGDLSNIDRQSVYALKEDFGSTSLGDVRLGGNLVEQTITNATTAADDPIRKASTNAVDWSLKSGWMVDLPSAGERVNISMVLALNVLSVATNIPTSDVCDAGGRSWLYKFDIGTGSAVSNAVDGAVAIPLGNVLVAGQTVVQLPDGRTVTISTLSDTTLRTDSQPPPPVAGLLRRTSWRELAN